MSALRRVVLFVAVTLGSLVVLAASGAAARTPPPAGLVEVVVTLPQPPLAQASLGDRLLSTAQHRVNLRSLAARDYVRTLATAQRTLAARIRTAIPAAKVRWHYQVTLNGMAIVVPRAQLQELSQIRGLTVWPSVRYHALLDRTPQLIGATQVWGPTLATAGEGMKIGIIDDGVDQTHPFFNPSGFTYPAGFPKGNTAYTTPKVIVARAFSPASNTWKYAKTPFDPANSDHATHVAGIAAGDHGTTATFNAQKFVVSGIAPDAYIGNYKVLTVPTTDFGLDGNSPEIAAGIEQAVKDGMDVINLSLGEPEVEPSRDIVVQAIDNAAAAGVIPVVAAGNSFGEAGRGGIGSPANAPAAITVAAASEGGSSPADVIANFSDSAPTPVSLQFKPDVTAPGEDVLSSIPKNDWDRWSGTSMASPHVAGAAALLRERHPAWTVQQIKSALATTGDPVRNSATLGEVAALREGGGRVDLPHADNPLVFVDPTSISFGLVQRGGTASKTITLTDAGGGLNGWTPAVAAQSAVKGATLTASQPTAGPLPSPLVSVTLTVASDAAEGDGYGFVTLTRGNDVRRVPYWFHVEVPLLGTESHRTLAKPGVYTGDTRGKKSLVSTYRYPEEALGAPVDLSGPEQVFRFVLTKHVANFGAAVVSHGSGVTVAPRVVVAGDENRLAGFSALPVDINPYRQYGRLVPSVGAILPKPGAYDIVFDTPAGARPGAFTFRFWINDTTPPRVRVLRSLPGTIRLAVTDAGSGVDPGSIATAVDGRTRDDWTFARGVLSIRHVGRGTHRVALTVADFQEPKNMEDVGPVLPNTRRFSARVSVR